MTTPDLDTTRRRFVAYFASAGLAPTLLPGVLWARVQEEPAGPITSAMLKDALAVAGLTFSDEQREEMVEGLNRNLERYEALRAIEIDDAIAPPMYFSPIVSGTRLDREVRPFRMSDPPPIRRPAELEDVDFWPLTHLAELVRTRQVTSVELTEMYLERLHRHNPLLNCVVTFTDTLALEQARAADSEIATGGYRGPLHGIPWGCKDIIAVPGYPTTWGSNAFKDQVIETETSGSILSPSTRCGVTGLRPTFGRVSRHGAMTLSWTRDRIGPMCRTAEDCAVVFHAIAKTDEQDLSVIDLPFNWDGRRDIRPLSRKRAAMPPGSRTTRPLSTSCGVSAWRSSRSSCQRSRQTPRRARTAPSPALSSTRFFDAAGRPSSGTKGGHRDTAEAD